MSAHCTGKMWYLIAVLVLVLALAFLPFLFPKDDCRVLSSRQLKDGTTLEIVDDQCKEGMPHTTTSTTVRMTQSIADSAKYEEIMTHERVHLDQKTRPAFWKELVKRVWAYEVLSAPPKGVPNQWTLRPNPDTDACPWSLWRGRYVFFAAYGEDRRLATARTHVWDLEEGRLAPTPPEWRGQFCVEGVCPQQDEHPYEIAAEFITHKSQSPASAALSSALG